MNGLNGDAVSAEAEAETESTDESITGIRVDFLGGDLCPIFREFPFYPVEKMIQVAVQAADSRASPTTPNPPSPFPVLVTVDICSMYGNHIDTRMPDGWRPHGQRDLRIVMPDVSPSFAARVLPEGRGLSIEHDLNLVVEFEQTMRDLEVVMNHNRAGFSMTGVPSQPFGSLFREPTSRRLLVTRVVANWIRMRLLDPRWLDNQFPARKVGKVWKDLKRIVDHADYAAFERVREALSSDCSRFFADNYSPESSNDGS